MNKLYKSIWNAISGRWTAVSEIQHCRGKRSKSVLTTAIISSLVWASVSQWQTTTNVVEVNLPNAPRLGTHSVFFGV